MEQIEDLDDYYAFSKQKVNVSEDFDTFVNEDIYRSCVVDMRMNMMH